MTCFAAPPKNGYDYTPQRTALPLPQSLVIGESWNDHVEFIYNRGPRGVSFLDRTLRLLDPKEIAALPGYTNPSATRITLMTYEFRSIEIRTRVEELLSLGFRVRIVVDSGPATAVQLPSKDVWKKWTTHQRRYFLGAYDRNRDGKVTEDDLAIVNQEKYLTIQTWQRLKFLQKRFPKLLDLVQSPIEPVPASDNYHFPRLAHFKMYSVDILKPDKTWAREIAMYGSANLTDSCLNRRIYQGKKNLERYLNGEPYSYAKGTEGHIQFGAIIRGSDVNEALSNPAEKWITAYRAGRHFDSVALPDEQNPRIVFQDPKNGHTTVLQAFFSEGKSSSEVGDTTEKLTSAKRKRTPIDPINVITEILSRPGVRLKVYDSDQFVFTHGVVARHFRHLLARGGLEDFNVFVDGNFAVETFSVLPKLLYSTAVNNRLAVLDGHSIQDMVQLPAELDWPRRVWVFEGERGVFGGPGDKLHAKHQYIEYDVDAGAQRHYLTVWGSGNQSNNAGHQNGDALFFLDSTDPSVGDTIRPYIHALKNEARMRPYSEAQLERRFLELFDPTGLEGLSETFYRDLAQNFSNPEKQEPDFLTNFLKRAIRLSPNRMNNMSFANGQNLIAILKWFRKTSTRKLDWVEWDLVLHFANPAFHPQPGFLHDLHKRWSAESNPRSVNSFNRMSQELVRQGSPVTYPDNESYKAVIAHLCESYLQRLGVTIPEEAKP